MRHGAETDGQCALLVHHRLPFVPRQTHGPGVFAHLPRSAKLDLVREVRRAVAFLERPAGEDTPAVGHRDAQAAQVATVRAGGLEGEGQRSVYLDLRGKLLRRG